MTQEEKAEAYDEAIKVIKDNLGALNEISETGVEVVNIQSIRNCFYRAFPELRESEDDRIRKALIKYYSFDKDGGSHALDNITPEQIVDWLEKQGKKVEPIESFNSEFEKQISRLIASAINREYEYTEAFIKWTSNTILNYAKHEIEQGEQKPTNKIKPKFKVGDKIIEKDFDECSCGTIINIKDGKYIFDNGGFLNIEEQGLWQLVEQKSAWSKEDKDMIETLVAIFEVNYPNDFYKVNPIGTTNMQAIHSSEIIKWLKSLRHQNRCTYNPYKEIVESIATMVEKYAPFDSNLQDFYDNVKVKCKDAKEYDSLFPQNRWKPSNEQMQALSNAGNSFRPFEEGHKMLWSLYNDLKKLREE